MRPGFVPIATSWTCQRTSGRKGLAGRDRFRVKSRAFCCQTEQAVCLNSATACMELILRVLDVGPGDEVITSAYTYTATASVTCHVGAKVVMVDTAPDSFEMDYDKLADAITEKTKVVLPVDLAGVVCDYDKIFAAVESKKHLFSPANDIQKAYGRVIVLADAAHAFGAKWHGKMCGEIADFTSFPLLFLVNHSLLFHLFTNLLIIFLIRIVTFM